MLIANNHFNFKGGPMTHCYTQLYQQLALKGYLYGIPLKPYPLSLDNYDSHGLKRMLERHISTEDAQRYISHALVMFSQCNGTRLTYYSHLGVATVELKNSQVILKTAWSHYDFDETLEEILELIDAYLFNE